MGVVSGGAGDKAVMITASSFKFEPNVIQAQRGDVLALKIENVSDGAHNLTIKDPRGDIVKSVDLPARETVHLVVDFPEAGVYEIYCDKPFHDTMGMKGRIEVHK
jgi:plastocyanin